MESCLFHERQILIKNQKLADGNVRGFEIFGATPLLHQSVQLNCKLEEAECGCKGTENSPNCTKNYER